MSTVSCSGYLTEAFHDFGASVSWVIRVLEEHEDEFDTIAFRGMSGAVIAPTVAYFMNKPMVLVRKSGDSTHSSCVLEGCGTEVERYVIVDDMVSTGATVREIQTQMWDRANAKCVGIVLYKEREWVTPERRPGLFLATEALPVPF